MAHHLLAHYPRDGGGRRRGAPRDRPPVDQGTSGVLVVARTPWRTSAWPAPSPAARSRRNTWRSSTNAVAAVGDRGSADRPARRGARYRPPGRQASAPPATGRSPPRRGSRSSSRPAHSRTHQIRVHLKHIGHPLIGDPVYGEARWKVPRALQPACATSPRQRPRLEAGVPASRQRRDAAVRGSGAGGSAEVWEKVAGKPFPSLN